MLDASNSSIGYSSPSTIPASSYAAFPQAEAAKSPWTFDTAGRRRVLMVERDPDLASVLSAELRGNHFVVDVVCQWEQAAEALRGKILYDLLMLDLVEEHGDSLALIHRLRPILPSLPMLVLTPRNNVQDKVCAFEAGADDCLSKPLALTELLARIRALVRRKSSAVSNCSRVADLVLRREERTVERNGRRIDLTPREFALLDVMMRNAGKSVSRVTLLSEVWNLAGQPSTNIVDVYMKYVRDKVDLTGEARLIHTLRGFGYVIRES